MIELIRSKQAGLPAPKEKAPARPANVVNLMDALRRSIEAGGGKAKPAKAGKARCRLKRHLPKKRARRRADGYAEYLGRQGPCAGASSSMRRRGTCCTSCRSTA